MMRNIANERLLFSWLIVVLSAIAPRVAAQSPLENTPPPNVGGIVAPAPYVDGYESQQRGDDYVTPTPLAAPNAAAGGAVSAYPEDKKPQSYYDRVDFIVSQQLAAGESCQNCGCGGEHRCGTGCPHPWRTGHGQCDDWCVGPHWNIQLDGVLLNRENFDLDGLASLWGVPNARYEQFGYEAGARGYATAYGDSGYGVQLGYVGVDHWQASGAAILPVTGLRTYTYTSGIHSGELNFLPDVYSDWRLILGVRYIQLNEMFITTDINVNAREWTDVKNKMIGVQFGARHDIWNYDDRFFLDVLAVGGAYRNRIEKSYQSGTVTNGPTTYAPYEDNETSFVGEAAVNAVYHLNRCVSLRGGYQILFVDAVTTADRAMIGPGMDVGSVFYHGGNFGVEYRR